MNLLSGMCQCRRRWWYTGELESVPRCGECGREHTHEDVMRVRRRTAEENEKARADSAVGHRAAARRGGRRS